MAKAVGEKRSLFKIWKKSKNGVDKAKAEVDRALYCSAKRSAKRAVCLAQSEQQRDAPLVVRIGESSLNFFQAHLTHILGASSAPPLEPSMN